MLDGDPKQWNHVDERWDAVSPRHSSMSAEWYTPAKIVEAARLAMGEIDLDPASSTRANETVRARNYYTTDENGFLLPWKGRVFLNPPGGRCDTEGKRLEVGGQSSAKAWWFKLAAEIAAERVLSAVFVGFSLEILQTTQVNPPIDVGTGERLPIPLDPQFDLCFPTRRVAFMSEDNGAGRDLIPVRGNTHASVIVFWSASLSGKIPFREAFAPIGAVR